MTTGTKNAKRTKEKYKQLKMQCYNMYRASHMPVYVVCVAWENNYVARVQVFRIMRLQYHSTLMQYLFKTGLALNKNHLDFMSQHPSIRAHFLGCENRGGISP